MGIFLAIIGHQKNILSQQELLSQTSYIQERLSRALRVAVRDEAGNCLSPVPGTVFPNSNYLLTRPFDRFFTGIKFLNQSDTDASGHPICEEFYLDTSLGVIKELKTYWPSYANDSQASDADAVALSSDKLDIQLLRFGIDGYNGGTEAGEPVTDQDEGFTELQPRITILLKVKGKNNSQVPPISIQTTVSQRNLNVQ